MDELDQFLDDMIRLNEHCAAVGESSDVQRYIDCEPFRRLTSFGHEGIAFLQLYCGAQPEVLPPIVYKPLLEKLLRDDRLPELPAHLQGKLVEANAFYSDWCDRNYF